MCINVSDSSEDYKAGLHVQMHVAGSTMLLLKQVALLIAPEVGLQNRDGEHNQQLIFVLVEEMRLT